MGKAWHVKFSPGAWQEHFLSSLDADFQGRFCFLRVLLFSEYGLSQLNSLEQSRYWSPVPSRSLQTGNAQYSACLTPRNEVTKGWLLPALLCSLQCQCESCEAEDDGEPPGPSWSHQKDRQHLCTPLFSSGNLSLKDHRRFSLPVL